MKSFNEIYQEIYKDSGEVLSQLKKQNRVRNVFLVIVTIALGIVAIIGKKPILWILFMIVLIGIIMVLAKEYAKYKIEYKEKVIKRFIKSYQETLEYYPTQGISSSEYRSTGFDGHYDRYHSEDLITGQILDGCKITMAEVHTEEEETKTDSDGYRSTEYDTIFHGLFAKIELNKAPILNFEIRKNNVLSDIFKGKQKLDMDSGEFEKIFDIKTQDKISTLRILTSDVMQMFIDFKNNNKVVPEIILDNSNLYIRFAVGNVFEPNLIKNDMDYDKLKETYNMINFTFELAKNFSKNIIDFEQ